MTTKERTTDEQVNEADRRNGEPGATDDAQDAELDHHDSDLDEHPEPGEMPSDYGVQAERQEPFD
jgi:hypothetical protein